LAQRQPAYLRRRNEFHWVERTACGRGVHIGYNVTLGDIAVFADEVAALAAERGTQMVVLDLRLNGGGDNRTYRPLLESLKRLPTGRRLAVLISRETFSAAMQFIVDLEEQTTAVFVGEPTGGSPNHFGNATFAWTTAGEDDNRLTRDPDIMVTRESGPYFSGKDPTLITALAEVP
jgi:hypothetical protein